MFEQPAPSAGYPVAAAGGASRRATDIPRSRSPGRRRTRDRTSGLAGSSFRRPTHTTRHAGEEPKPQQRRDGTLRPVTKTPSSTATLPLLLALERELKAYRSRQASIDLRFVKPDALIFTTATGKPQSRRNALRALHKAGNNAGLNSEGAEPVGLHDLRHSLVALSLDCGLTLAEAAVLARHADAKVTGAIYAGVSEKAKAQIASKLVDAGFGSYVVIA
ncbi:MAG: hypothetical protein C5B48_04630 [Candidatus Rokuibacteriota bacterium]|nr:MAG: hypothetical protein C5B48_04630 [Candidatus Rokubacteria bacterium]